VEGIYDDAIRQFAGHGADRSFISLAALLVKVTARMFSAGTRFFLDQVGNAGGDDLGLADPAPARSVAPLGVPNRLLLLGV
jgi:hypothetical protein